MAMTTRAPRPKNLVTMPSPSSGLRPHLVQMRSTDTTVLAPSGGNITGLPKSGNLQMQMCGSAWEARGNVLPQVGGTTILDSRRAISASRSAAAC